MITMIIVFTALWYAMWCFDQQERFKPEHRIDDSSAICSTIATSIFVGALIYFAPPHAELFRVGIIAAAMYGCILAKWLGARYYNRKEGIENK